ncbi:hypothetical protein BS47DRAFT_122972 [Hydnum rufescens UP504]|uniref:non-specific serine/threonine protein kinase n=1 Tax=Hydnum rufescens UP504 TaxID=1448309 RepID=A0A9P6B8S7_9AGAM|nr:hypothetical protein BS47DRAFT_122972 [Hydnum rufescens UP504]
MANDTKFPLYSLQNVLIDSGNLVLGSFLGHGAHGAIYQATSLQKWQRSSFLVSPSAAASPVLAIRRLQKKRPPAPSITKIRYAVKAVFSSAGETEAHLHSRASGHRGILTLHRVIREGPFMYFVLDLCPSGDLFEAVSRRVYFQNVQAIKSIFLQLIDAVEHCHVLGIFHRDLRLENILLKNEVGEPPHIVLSDFGLATEEIWARDRTGSQMYMSPEHLGRYGPTIEDYDCAANDIWAMGVIFVILILGNCAPWAMASDACPVFHNYTHNTRDFFARRHGMTVETNALMTRIFELNPPRRISLTELRPTIHALNEFTDIAVQGEHDRAVLSNPPEDERHRFFQPGLGTGN